MKLYTVGFTQKSAKTFFELLKKNGVQRLVDIRISPQGQLAGFARQEDLPYFLDELADRCEYVYMPILAPTKDMMHEYRGDRDWQRYRSRFEALMDERKIPDVLNQAEFEALTTCFLCSEAKPDSCHRRLVAERLAAHWPSVEIIHL